MVQGNEAFNEARALRALMCVLGGWGGLHGQYLVESMPNRIKVVVNVKGSLINYYDWLFVLHQNFTWDNKLSGRVV